MSVQDSLLPNDQNPSFGDTNDVVQNTVSEIMNEQNESNSILVSTEQTEDNSCSKFCKKMNIFAYIFAPGSVRGGVFNLCSATLGAGALSLPSAFQMSGWIIGIILLLIGELMTILTINFLVKAREASGYKSYEDMTLYLYGRFPLLLVNLGILLFSLGTSTGYIIAIRDIFENIISFDVLPSWLANKYILTSVFWLLVMLPLSSLRSIDNLRFSSFFGILSVLYLVISVVILCCTHFSIDLFNSLPYWKWDISLMKAVPIMLFAYSCQCNVYEIQTELGEDNGKKMNHVSWYGMTTSCLIYIAIGISGYFMFGSSIQGNILKNLIDYPYVYIIISFFAITFTVVMAFPLNIFPSRFTIVSFFWGDEVARDKTDSSWKALLRHYSISFALCLLCLVLGLLIDDLSVVFQFLGGVASTLICFAYPAFTCIVLKHRQLLNMNMLYTILAWILLIASLVIGIISIVTLFM